MAGLGCAAALGVAEWLRPRRTLNFMPPGARLTELFPKEFGSWLVAEGGDIVIPRTEGSLASRLYSDQLARLYRDKSGAQPDVMMLIAYGKAQRRSLAIAPARSLLPSDWV